MTSRLDNRLNAVKKLVRQGSVAADIGCDHGYLMTALVSEGICPRGFACDINTGPLSRAKKTISGAGLSGRIQTVLTCGLAGLPYNEISDIVIAGMGGDLIGEILLGESWTRDERLHFILQPMTKANHLRRILLENGFSIKSETAASVNKIVYTIMSVTYTKNVQTPDLLFQWTGKLLANIDADSLSYLEQVAKRLIKKSRGIASSKHTGDAKKYEALAAIICERIEKVCTE